MFPGFLSSWTGKKGNCFNHLLQRTIIKAFTGLDLQCTGLDLHHSLGKVIFQIASAMTKVSGMPISGFPISKIDI